MWLGQPTAIAHREELLEYRLLGRKRTIVRWPPDDAFASPTAAIRLSSSERVKPTQIS